MKLSGRKTLDPTSIIQEEPIGPQTALEIVSMNPEEMFQMLEEELEKKTPEEDQHIKNTIKNLCKLQALAQRHAANSANSHPQQDDWISTWNVHRPELHPWSHNTFRPSTLGTRSCSRGSRLR